MGLNRAALFSALLIFLGFHATQVKAASTDREAQENAQLRARVKEGYFEIQTDLRRFLGEQTEKRALAESQQNKSSPLQAEVRNALPLELRFDGSITQRGLEELFLYVDGLYWGNFKMHTAGLSSQNVFWYFNSIKSIPIGERQLKFVARLSPPLRASFLKDQLSETNTLEGIHSVFVSDGLKALALNLATKSDVFKNRSWIEIERIAGAE